MSRKGARSLTPHRVNDHKVDRFPLLAEQAKQVTADPVLAERLDRTAVAIFRRDSGDLGADALVYAPRVILSDLENDNEKHLAALALHSARKYAATRARDTADEPGSVQAPYSLTDADLALDEAAEIDADPQNRYRYTPAGLLADLVPLTMDELRKESAVLPALPDDAEPRTPERKIADRMARALYVRNLTSEDRYGLTLRHLTTAQQAAKTTAAWNRSGWTVSIAHNRPMTGRAPLPNSGPASAVVSTDKAGRATVEGMPWDEVRDALGMPEAPRGAVMRRALSTLLRSASDDRPTIGGALLPPAEWAKAKRLEDVDDKRRHEAAQPIKKPNPRKRPKGGRLGTSASIR